MNFCFKFFNLFTAGAKLVLPPAGEIPQLKPVNVNRPRMPPPPGPPNGKICSLIFTLQLKQLFSLDKNIANGQSSESLNSLNDGHGQNAARVQGTPIRKVRKVKR
jgi:hypothetical protein